MKSLFHLADRVMDVQAARQFYGDLLGCREGRSTATGDDFDFLATQFRCIWVSRCRQQIPAWWVSTRHPCPIWGEF